MEQLRIESVRRVHGRATLTLSDGQVVAMPRALLRERPYKSGMPFDPESFRRLLAERSYRYALEKAVSLLSLRARTEGEIRKALADNAYPPDAIEHALARIGEAGYVDDASFARQFVDSRMQRGLGKRRISMDLRRKGVAADVIDEAFEALDEDDALESAVLAARKAARGRDLSTPEGRQKTLAALARRGFDFSTAKKALGRVMDEPDE